MINEEDFRDLVHRMLVVQNNSRGEEEIMFMLQMVDPYNNQRMTFSEVVHLLSSHMVPLSEDNPNHLIPFLEKFVNQAVNNFEDIEQELQERDEQQMESP